MITHACLFNKQQTLLTRARWLLDCRKQARWNSSNPNLEKRLTPDARSELPPSGFWGRHFGKLIAVGFVFTLYVWQQIQLNDKLHRDRNSQRKTLGEVLQQLPKAPSMLYNLIKVERKKSASEVLKDHKFCEQFTIKMSLLPRIWRKLSQVSHAAQGPQPVYQQSVNKNLVDLPSHIKKPDYSPKALLLNRFKSVVEIKNEQQIENLKNACSLAKEILAYAESLVKVGVTTDDIDQKIHHEIITHGAYPSPLSYKGFPKSCCTSVNNVVCHGIPDDYQLKNGDIINIDITVYLNGSHGDTSNTFPVGGIDPVAEKLISVTRHCLELGISSCAPGKSFSDIGNIIEPYANKSGFTVCKEFVGHGIGSYFHGPPIVYHTCNTSKGTMKSGMAFTIEPILMEGSNQVEKLYDGWTVVSKDRLRSAQAEHTVLVTDSAVEVLT